MNNPAKLPELDEPELASLPDVLVFIDGECAFCSNSARFILQNDARGRIHIATLQGSLAARLLPGLGLDEASMQRIRTDNASLDGIICVLHAATPQARLYERSRASRMIARQMRFPYGFLGWISWWLPDWLLDPLYAVIKRNRHRLAKTACALPPPELRTRYLD